MPRESTRYSCPVCTQPLFLMMANDEEYELECLTPHKSVEDRNLVIDVCELIMERCHDDFGSRVYDYFRGG